MDLKNLLCNNTTTTTNTTTLINDDKDYCSLAPVYMFDYKDTWSSNSSEITDSPQSSPSLSLYSTFSSPKTTYLSATTVVEQQQQQSTFIPANNNNNSTSTTQTRTPWTASEDFLLQKGYSQGLSWAMISSTYLPHRSRGCCWGRFKTLQAKMSDHKEWTTSEDQALLLAIKKHDRLFKQAWKAVAREMDNRSWRECDVRASKLSRMVRKQQHQRKLY